MKLNKFKFNLFYLLGVTKFSFTYLYFYLSSNYNKFDYIDLYTLYCKTDTYGETDIVDLLDFGINFIFPKFCFLEINQFIFVFFLFQLFIIYLALNKLINLYKNSKKMKNLLLIILFSPSVLFFSSVPSKDGFFLIFICISIIFCNFFSKVFLFCAILIKPYLVFFYFNQLKTIYAYILFILMVIFISIYLDEVYTIFLKKKSVIDYFDTGVFEFLWIFEILIVLFFTIKAKIIRKKILFLLICLILFAGGLNFNVSSRICTLGIFFLIAHKYSYDIQKKII
jgi:hypothetical protein